MPSRPIPSDVSDLVQAFGLLVRRFRAIGDGPGLSWTEGIILRRLDKEGPATSAELAREVGVKPQSMGATIAALEKKGLVDRKPHASDGRQVSIALSPGGSAARKSARDAKTAWLAEGVARLNPQDRKTLFAAGAIMQRLAA